MPMSLDQTKTYTSNINIVITAINLFQFSSLHYHYIHKIIKTQCLMVFDLMFSLPFAVPDNTNRSLEHWGLNSQCAGGGNFGLST